MSKPENHHTIETHGPDLEHFYSVNIHKHPGSMLNLRFIKGGKGYDGDDPVFARRPQRSRDHESDVYFTDAQNMTRVKNLLSLAKEHGQLSHKHLREIIYRIDVTHPELPI